VNRPGRKKGRAQLTKAVLASDLSDLLHLYRGKHGNCDEGRRIVDSIFRVIIDALHRGESVTIYGLGKFYISKSRPARYKPYVAKGVRSPVLVDYPSKPLVRFRPTFKVDR
jgi:nucleoid DNA-binding protein